MLKHDGPATERVELTLETVELLRIAATVATNVRRGSHRKVNIYKPATGETLRQAPLDEYYTGIAKTLDLTFSLRDDVRQTVCAGWEGPCPKKSKPSKGAFAPSMVRGRKGQPWRCRSCAVRMFQGQRTPDDRAASIRKGRDQMTPEQRSDCVKKRHARRTKQQRSEIARAAWKALPVEKRSEFTSKGAASRTTENRAEVCSKVSAAKTAKQRRDAARKAWATRRAKAAK